MCTEPDLPTEGTSAGTSNFLCRSSSRGMMGNSVEDSALAGAELTGLSPEASATLKLPERNDLPVNSHPGPGSWTCPESPEDVFNNFLYWRTPLPDISKDLEELLLSEAGPREKGCSRPEPVQNSCVARSEIQKVLDSLQEHVMDDPDVQGKRHPS